MDRELARVIVKPLLTAIVGAAALSAAAPAVAQAAPDEGEVAIDGSVAPLCILGDPNPALVDLGILINTSGTRIGKIRTIANQNVLLANSFCNFAGSVVTITANAMLRTDPTPPPASFARAVNYTATASGWTSNDASVTTSALANGANPSASGTGATQPLPKFANIGVQLSNFTAPGDAFLVAGDYTGSVIVTLGPTAASN